MTSVLSHVPLSYAVPPEHRRYRSSSAVREPGLGGHRAAPVRLHLKPGQKGTKQLLAQYGDRLICVRYRYDVQRKKRLKRSSFSSPNAIGNRHGLASPTTRSSGYASPLPTWQSATR